jgi:hypothetical protein
VTIHNRERFLGSLPDWAFFDGCFGTTRIRPTDIDGCVERNGKILFLEHKGPGAKLSEGQRRLFRAMQKCGHTTIVFWGALGDGGLVISVSQIEVFKKEGWAKIVDPGPGRLRTLVADWYADVNR